MCYCPEIRPWWSGMWELWCPCLEKRVRSWEIIFHSALGVRVTASSSFLLLLCLSTSPCKLEINLVLPMRFLLWETADVWINHVQQIYSTEHRSGKESCSECRACRIWGIQHCLAQGASRSIDLGCSCCSRPWLPLNGGFLWQFLEALPPKIW